MNPEDPWNFEAWSIGQRAVLLAFLSVVPVAALTGWALIPLVLILVYAVFAGAVVLFAYREYERRRERRA